MGDCSWHCCCDRIKGVENIKVRSLVGRYLEQPVSVFYGHQDVFMSSADWMPMLDRRIDYLRLNEECKARAIDLQIQR